MNLIQFEAGTKASDAKVTINGVDYPVTPARYTGNTPLSAYIFNLMQSNIAKAVVPTGGTIGQVLVKKSNTDNDVEWQTVVVNVVQIKSNSTTDVYSCDYINNKLSYSTTEKVVGEWIDGKPLYRKVVDLGTLPDNSTKAVAHSIQNLKKIVKLEGFAGSSLNKGGITLPHATNTPIALYADDTNVSVKTTSDATGYTGAYAFVYYTKTTD